MEILRLKRLKDRNLTNSPAKEKVKVIYQIVHGSVFMFCFRTSFVYEHMAITSISTKTSGTRYCILMYTCINTYARNHVQLPSYDWKILSFHEFGRVSSNLGTSGLQGLQVKSPLLSTNKTCQIPEIFVVNNRCSLVLNFHVIRKSEETRNHLLLLFENRHDSKASKHEAFEQIWTSANLNPY